MDPFVRVLTSERRGAIAVVHIWGTNAIEVVDAVFRPARGKPLAETRPGRLRLGRAGLGLGDEVVAVRLAKDMPTVEIQCHGGTAAVESVVAALEAAGARRVDHSEIGQGRTDDPLATQALVDLALASTLRTAEILLDQVHGALGREIDRLRRVVELAANPPLAALDGLIGRAAVGLRLLSGWKVAIAGRPNVGKSRLFNALAGFDRAIVDPAPGVTRDVVTFRTAFGGWPVELADTAGLRATEDAIESMGIARSRREQVDADFVLLVLDRSEPLQLTDHELIGSMAGALVVANKSDLPPAWDPREAGQAALPIATVSAERGHGIAELIATIVPRLVPTPPAPGDAIPFRPAQLDRLRQVRACLDAGDRAEAARRLVAMVSGRPR